jgi:hypothetical protein
VEGEGPKEGETKSQIQSLFDARAPALLGTHGATPSAARIGKGGRRTGRMGEGRSGGAACWWFWWGGCFFSLFWFSPLFFSSVFCA